MIELTCPACGAMFTITLPLPAPNIHPLGGVDLPVVEDLGVDEHHAVFIGPRGVDVRCGWNTG